jgi:hypothetical protein
MLTLLRLAHPGLRQMIIRQHLEQIAKLLWQSGTAPKLCG